MCTVVVLVRPGHAWPLLLAANRDEMQARAWDPPAAHWPDAPGVTAGRDRTGHGTWLGINRHGVIASVLNRAGSLGPLPGKRSRGGLPLLALRQQDAARAAAAVGDEHGAEYRSFNMVIADTDGAWFVRGLGTGRPAREKLPPGLHMVTARDPNDLSSPRVAAHLPRFHAAAVPEPPDDWAAWQALLTDGSGPIGSQLNVAPHGGFATVCASLMALSADGRRVWRFAAGPPHEAPFGSVL